MYKAYCCDYIREACSTKAKLALGDLETEGQEVAGLQTTPFIERKQPLKYKTYSDKIGRKGTLLVDLELEG